VKFKSLVILQFMSKFQEFNSTRWVYSILMTATSKNASGKISLPV